MLDGTAREVLELLAEQPRSPTEVAEELGVSDQTASRHLRQLAADGYAEEERRGRNAHRPDPRRGYKQYRMREFAQVFAGYDGELFEHTSSLTDSSRAVFSVLRVPQERYHAPLLSYLFTPHADRLDLGVIGIVVYGSVARGTAQEDSDIDLLVVYDPEEFAGGYQDTADPVDPNELLVTTFGGANGFTGQEELPVYTEQWFSVSDFTGGLHAGSQFLRNVLDEGIVLYDPEGVIRDARQERAGESVPQ